MSKNICSVLILSCCLLVGCGAPKEIEQEADAYKKKYAKEFENTVHEVLGDSAELKNVEGHIDSVGVGVWFDRAYFTDGTLDGTITYNGKDYEASYDTNTGEIESTINLELIKKSFLSTLPLDNSKIVYCGIFDNCSSVPQFNPSVSTFRGAVDEEDYLIWCVLTTEDISHLTEEDFGDYIEITKPKTNYLRIFSCADGGFDNLEELERDLYSTEASNYGSHPKVYSNKSNDDVDIFDYYNLAYTCDISQQSYRDDNDIMVEDVRYYLLSNKTEEPLYEYSCGKVGGRYGEDKAGNSD